MTTHEHDSAGARSLVRRGGVRALSRQAAAGALTALERLAGGTGTAVLALLLLGWLLVVAVLCVLGVGVLLAPAAVRALHTLAPERSMKHATLPSALLHL